MSCVSCGQTLHGPAAYCPDCGHPQQAAVTVLDAAPELSTTQTASSRPLADDRHAIGGRLIAASALYFLLPFLVSVLVTGFAAAVVCTVLEVAGLLLVRTTTARRAGAIALAVLTSLAWSGVGGQSSSTVRVAVTALLVLQFVGWLVAARRRGLPYVLLVPSVGLAFVLGPMTAGGGWLYAMGPSQALVWNLVQGVLWALLGLFAAWMPVPARRPETAGGAVPAGVAPSAGSETSTLSVLAFVASFFVSVAGVVLGHMALGELRRTGKRGRGLAVAALVIGYGAIALTLIAVLAFLAGSGLGS